MFSLAKKFFSLFWFETEEITYLNIRDFPTESQQKKYVNQTYKNH